MVLTENICCANTCCGNTERQFPIPELFGDKRRIDTVVPHKERSIQVSWNRWLDEWSIVPVQNSIIFALKWKVADENFVTHYAPTYIENPE